MKIDFTKVLKNLKGESLKNDDEIKEEKNKDETIKTKAKPATDFTLRDAALNILLLPPPNREGREISVSGKENLDRYQLAQKINANDIVDITTAQRDLIKNSTTKIYTAAMISGQVWDMLERTAVIEENQEPKIKNQK